MATDFEADKSTVLPTTGALSAEDAISMFNDMLPSKEVVMRREMEKMFPSIMDAMQRDVSEEQIIAGLRKKWPGAHVATIIKQLNSERQRRLAQGESVTCRPFGSPRRSAMRRATTISNTGESAQISPTRAERTNGDQHEMNP